MATGIHYPVPLHMTKAYEYLDLKPGSFPVAELAASEFVSLPMFPELTDDQISYVRSVRKRVSLQVSEEVTEVKEWGKCVSEEKEEFGFRLRASGSENRIRVIASRAYSKPLP